MNKLEERLEEALKRIEELEFQVPQLAAATGELAVSLDEQVYRFEAFAEPCAIGSEQLWEVVFNDILKRPVPSGVNLRDLI
tara:strand:- start:1753 stop:1995 length:243 start_codon:yes stop_codon:yes gene_type:complete